MRTNDIDESLFVPSDIAELSSRLTEAAADERARLAASSQEVLDVLRERPRDLLDGSVDAERGSAHLVFSGIEVVAATEDVPELGRLTRLARVVPVRLELARASEKGPVVLVFAVADWRVVAAVQTLALR